MKWAQAGESLIHSKFKDIVFPFFGKKHNPYNIKYRKDIIEANLTKDHKYYTIDKITDDTLGTTYYQRLFNLENRIEYDFTCRNLSELINSPVLWGVDDSGKIFDLSNKERFKTKTSSIRKIVNPGLIWLHRISYPFVLDRSINLSEIDPDVLKAIVVYIDNTWVLYKFTYENSEISTILL